MGERGVSDRPMSTHKLNHLEGEGWANQGVGEHGESPERAGEARQFYKSHHREQTGIPAKSLQLSNTGFFRSLADKRRLGQWSIDIS